MDHNLIKIYESLLNNSAAKNNEFSLKHLYEAKVAKSSKSQDLAKLSTSSPKLKSSKPVSTSDPDLYDKIIAKTLLGDPDKHKLIPLPSENYTLGTSVNISNAQDLKYFKQLFAVTPPKTGQSLETSVGTKGSGNGEIALYWLLQKKYRSKVADGRGGSEPDLKVSGVGVEVKAYDTKKIGLGRFGDQRDNRLLLSIAFGIKTLLSSFSAGKSSESRVPSLDTFNKFELIQAFTSVLELNSNASLRQISPTFPPIKALYDQIDHVLKELGYANATKLKANEETAKEVSAKLLIKFLNTKLELKPGFGGYLATVWASENSAGVSYTQINEGYESKLSSDEILDNVNANGAALLINPDNLFK